MSKPILLVLAAGMGSRYGGVKQIEPIGPNQAIILEYSVFDAIRAGFGKVIFVIRRDIEKDFVEHVLPRFSSKIEVGYVFQDMTDMPVTGLTLAERKKPWGTSHAVYAARAVIDAPFAVINADDFYGSDAFLVAGKQLAASDPSKNDFCMVGYELAKTVSDFGSVSRGLCQVDTQGNLTDVVEHTKISKDAGGIKSLQADGSTVKCSGNETVSMNFFGFTPPIFKAIETQFVDFIKTKGQDPGAEFFIPLVVNSMIHDGSAKLKVLRSNATWFGITYKEDLPDVKAGLRTLIDKGDYPEQLWA